MFSMVCMDIRRCNGNKWDIGVQGHKKSYKCDENLKFKVLNVLLSVGDQKLYRASLVALANFLFPSAIFPG